MSPVSSRTIMMSSPETTSGLSVEASASSGNTVAGRRLAKKSHSLRSPRMAFSGRLSRGSVSYRGPPTAPNSTASEALTRSRVAWGRGSPCASYAAPPTRASSVSILRPSPRKTSRTRAASRRISGPMPSPARSAIFMPVRSGEDPGLGALAAFLVGLDLGAVAQREADLVPAVQEALLARGIDVEAHRRTAGRGHRLRREVDGEPVSGRGGGFAKQLVDLGLLQDHGKEPVLEGIVEEDVGERRRDDRLETILLQCPRGVLARGAAAEVLARQQDRSPLVARLVQDEIGIGPALREVHARLAHVEIAPRVEQVRAKAGALDRLQELLRDDRVGVDILAIQGRHEAGVDGELFHQCGRRMSTKCPAKIGG